MESSLFFFLAGLLIFGMNRCLRNRPERIRFFGFVGSGLIAGMLLTLIVGPPWQDLLRIPAVFVPAMTGFAGIILFMASRAGIITKPGIQYLATTAMGIGTAVLSYGTIALYRILSGRIPFSAQTEKLLILLLLLASFLTVLGFTFPERWFKQKHPQESSE